MKSANAETYSGCRGKLRGLALLIIVGAALLWRKVRGRPS